MLQKQSGVIGKKESAAFFRGSAQNQHLVCAIRLAKIMSKSVALTLINKLASLTMGINAYSDAGAARKDTMHRCGKAFLHVLATELGLAKGAYDIRNNLGGIAVSGEVTLHGEAIFVQLSQSGNGCVAVLFRDCNGRKDYYGGQNNFISIARINEGAYAEFLDQCKALMQREQVAA